MGFIMGCEASVITRCMFLVNWLGYLIYIGLVFLIISLLPDPVDKGVFCGDTSIIYPEKAEIISSSALILMLGVPVAILFTLVICICVFIQIKETIDGDDQKMYMLTSFLKRTALTVLPTWLLFSAGAATCYLIVEIAKLSVGKYRPHFLYVCKPHGESVNPSWVTFSCDPNTLLLLANFNCAADKDEVDDALKSFPSGHASLAFYWAVFGVAHLEFCMSRSRKLHFFKGLLQVSLLALASIIAFSRVSDNNHDLVDVLVGIVIGTLIALCTFRSYPNTCHRNSFGICDAREMPISRVPPSQHANSATRKSNSGHSNKAFSSSEQTWQM